MPYWLTIYSNETVTCNVKKWHFFFEIKIIRLIVVIWYGNYTGNCNFQFSSKSVFAHRFRVQATRTTRTFLHFFGITIFKRFKRNAVRCISKILHPDGIINAIKKKKKMNDNEPKPKSAFPGPRQKYHPVYTKFNNIKNRCIFRPQSYAVEFFFFLSTSCYK